MYQYHYGVRNKLSKRVFGGQTPADHFGYGKNKQIKFFNTGVVLFIVILVAITNHRNSFWSNAEMLYKND